MAAIQIIDRQKKAKVDKRRFRGALQKIMKRLDPSGREITVILLDDAGIRELNARHLDRDRPTNVISFPMQEGEHSDINPHILGDIAISVETAERDASKGGLTLEQELDFLAIHGILHLLGYDHEKSKKEAKEMKEMERELFEAVHKLEIR
ncbi:MAG: rRNA maturation RNase YbeY [Syntrophales bacterium]|jgi:probable rRNA maturation factor|nr:rRNA maturation RNase YbeY [Syntrophales bacterium]MDD5232553.1 rRNA maturation RNase YbeY [Syntrophales bacterium]HPL63395.1 rRNA maturation RNase YbeY [Syntrophales bacterium]